MDCMTRIRVLDGPHAGRRSLFLGMGLNEDGARFEIARSGDSETELCSFRAMFSEMARQDGFAVAEECASNVARRWHLHSYRLVEGTRWYQRPRYVYEGTFALRVVVRASGIDLVRGAQILAPSNTPSPDVRVSGCWYDALAAVEANATRFSAAVAALEAGPVRDSAAMTARAVDTSVQDARRLAALGTQLGTDLTEERAARVFDEIGVLASTLDAALTEVVNLHLEVRERPIGAFDELSAASTLRALTSGVAEARPS